MTPPWLTRRQTVTPHAVVQVDTNRITGRWRAFVAPLEDDLCWFPAPAAELALVGLCDSPAQVRALLAGAA